MSNDDKKQALQTSTEADDEPDEWSASQTPPQDGLPNRDAAACSKPEPATSTNPLQNIYLTVQAETSVFTNGSAPSRILHLEGPYKASNLFRRLSICTHDRREVVPDIKIHIVHLTPLPDVPSSAQTDGAGSPIDWSSSFHGLGTATFGPDVATMLQAPLHLDDIEVKPDGIIYLPEIKYRRVLNAAFGPGGWGLAPRGDLQVQDRLVFRDYALIAHGRFVGQARGEMQYFNEDGISTAAEGCKSNALMRCCKDLGIASELWDPRFIRSFLKSHAQQVWVEHVATKKKKQIWLRKDDEVRYPFKKTN
ncbi:hypothetical protein SCUP515_01636 [Seiridium cupressi]